LITLKKNRWGDAAFWKPVFRLGMPVALQNLLSSSAGMVDTLMIGQMGDVSVAAVGMAGQWAWLMHIILYGASAGASVFLSQYWGAKDKKGIHHAYGVLALACLSISVLMAAVALLMPGFVMRLFSKDEAAIEIGIKYLRIVGFSYLGASLTQVFSTVLRSTEEVRLPLFAGFLSVLTNTILNYGLIFGHFGLPAMGVQGAALATVIASWVSPLLLLGVSLKRRNLLIAPPRALFGFDKAFLKRFIRVSTPALLNEGLWAMGTMGYNMVFGRMGTTYYAALTIFRTIEGLFFAFYIGMCHACGVLVGREIGAGNIEESKRYADRLLVAMPLMSVGLALIMVATRGLFLSLFNVSPEVAESAKAILLVYAIEIPIRNVSYIAVCGIFRPGGDTRTGVKYDVLTVWAMSLPVTILCGLVLKLDFVLVYALMLVTEDWYKAFLCIRRVRSRKWIKPVVEGAIPAPAE
jgi:putative MATE family efflux protein